MTPVEELMARARREVDEGILPACQVALGRHGEVVAFEAFGEATTGTRFPVYSCIKPFVAGAVWVLMGEAKVDVSRRVAEYIPEFGTLGKDVVTVEQVLLHTSGFPRATLYPPEWDTRAGRLEALGQWKLDWEPGTRYEYHPSSAHWVLAELVERLSGVDYRAFVHERVTGPAGVRYRVLGVPPDQQDDIAPAEVRGEGASSEELETVLGVRELPRGEVTHEALLYLDRPEVRALGIPGGGGIMTAADLALLYQALLHNPGAIWDPEILADATGKVRNRFADPLFGLPANRTLGLIQAGDDGMGFLRGFGHSTSALTFGHGGAGGQVAWADPVSGLSLGFATNGLDAHVIRQVRRGVEISTLAGACA